MHAILLILTSFAISWIGIRMLLPRLRRHAIFDRPNARSNHSVPTPRGGGLAVIAACLICLAAAHMHGALIISALVLAIVSWRDDTKGLSAQTRLIWQFIAVAFAYPALLPHAAGWMLWLELPLVVIAWIWFTNLTNFMDGIDGISVLETISIGLGLLAVHFIHPALPYELAVYGLILAAAMLAFGYFNRHPAQLFLGDVGSIPLGFFLGFLLLSLAANGEWAAALILPAYYLADSGITLLRRIRRRENIMQAHSSHYYQQAVAAGLTHSQVVQRIALLNLLLIALAALSTQGMVAALLALAIAYGCTLALLRHFAALRS